VRVGGEHARHEGRDDRARGLRTEPARRERVHRLVLAGGARAGDERLLQEIEFAAPREEVAAHERHRIARQLAQLAVEEDPPLLRGRSGLVDGDAELVAQRERTARWPTDERARRMLARETAAVRGPDDAPRAWAGLEHAHVVTGGDQRARRGQPTDAGADDRQLHDADSSRTAVTIARTCSGSVCGNTP